MELTKRWKCQEFIATVASNGMRRTMNILKLLIVQADVALQPAIVTTHESGTLRQL